MKKNQLEIGSIIKAARKKMGLTQLEVATALGYESTQFVSLFERGLSKCPVSVMGSLSVILKIPKKSLLVPLFEDFKLKSEAEFQSGIDLTIKEKA